MRHRSVATAFFSCRSYSFFLLYVEFIRKFQCAKNICASQCDEEKNTKNYIAFENGSLIDRVRLKTILTKKITFQIKIREF